MLVVMILSFQDNSLGLGGFSTVGIRTFLGLVGRLNFHICFSLTKQTYQNSIVKFGKISQIVTVGAKIIHLHVFDGYESPTKKTIHPPFP